MDDGRHVAMAEAVLDFVIEVTISEAVPPLGMLRMHPPPPAMFADLVKQH